MQPSFPPPPATQGETTFFSRHVLLEVVIGEGAATYHGELDVTTVVEGRDTRNVMLFR